MPHPDRIRQNRWLRIFGEVLFSPNLWHLNRESVARAFAIGLFWCMIPMPFQMIPAGACAIIFRGNVPLSLALVWVTNPLTMPIVFYANYRLGKWLMGAEVASPPAVDWGHFWDWSMWQQVGQWMMQEIALIWKPLYLGSFISGLVLSLCSYLIIREMWRQHVLSRWRQRALRRRRLKADTG